MIAAHRQLATDLAAAVGEAATVVTDSAKAGALLHAGPVIILDPPAATWPTRWAADLEWSAYVVAGPPHDIDTAHAAIWEVIDLIPDPDAARPAAFQPQTGPPWPAYVVTITRPIDID